MLPYKFVGFTYHFLPGHEKWWYKFEIDLKKNWYYNWRCKISKKRKEKKKMGIKLISVQLSMLQTTFPFLKIPRNGFKDSLF